MRVLITGCGALSKELIDAMKDNKDGEEIFVVGINNNPDALLRENVDVPLVVPPITAPEYIDVLLDICKKYEVQIVIPYITKELPLLSKNIELFRKNGIFVSVASEETLNIVNNKIELYKKFGKYMPPQIVPKNIEEVRQFCNLHKSVCCKIDNGCGGVGFCVVDDTKAYDVGLINKAGKPRYITKDFLFALVEKYIGHIIIQEYIEGIDYSSCVLADGNKVKAICGYYGYEMSNGCVINGEIKKNDEAYAIHKEIVEKTNLDGNSCADFIVKDGKAYLLEINPRVNGSLPFVWRAGGNYLYDRCRMLLGYKSDKTYEYKYGLRMKKYYEANYF